MNNIYIFIGIAFGAGAAIGTFISEKRHREIEKGNENQILSLRTRNRDLQKKLKVYLDDRMEKAVEAERNLDRSIETVEAYKEVAQSYSTSEGRDFIRLPYEVLQHDYPESTEVQLIFYAIDEIVTDEKDNIVANPAILIGKDIFESLKSENSDAIYVHNVARDVNYEVIIEPNKGYYRDILGEEFDPRI